MRASPSLLSKTTLFTNYKQGTVVFSFLCLIFTLSLFNHYLQFKKLTQYDDYITRVWVENQYIKNEKWVLKLQSEEGFSFYTTSKDDLILLNGYELEVRLFTKKLSFFSYLKGFYLPSKILSRLTQRQNRYILMDELSQVHQNSTASLFNALFLAGPIDKFTRDKLSAWGINHLLAISGFHLGVLSGILFFVFRPIYIPLQARYFPFRHGNRDIAIAVFALLLVYLYFLNLVPSLLRAFAMSLFAYILYDRGVKILSFSSLGIVVCFLIALWPKLLFALGFWFSVAGVFYIFLFLHHMKDLKLWQSFLLLHIWVYLAMLPLVHYFYGTFSLYQLASPILTMLFILFYPLELFLHLIGQGSMLDFGLEWLLSLDMHVAQMFVNIWTLTFYIILSGLAIFGKRLFYLLGFFCAGLLGYFLYGIA
jgi:competence protein ComEC